MPESKKRTANTGRMELAEGEGDQLGVPVKSLVILLGLRRCLPNPALHTRVASRS